jgi:hypothetical protein
MAQVLAFIENDMYVRNFVTSGAFDRLMKEREFRVCLSEIAQQLSHTIPAEKTAGIYQRNGDNVGLTYQFNKVSMLALRDRSSTFDIKVRKAWMGEYSLDERLIASTKDLAMMREFFVRQYRPNGSLEAVIARERPQIVLFPVTGVEATGTELILLSRKYGFRTFFLVNGWDNLSSKGAFPILPDYMGLWGLQSVTDAVNIHGMPEHRLIMLGCARYEDYFRKENAEKRIFPFPYILFAGATTPCDEIAPLAIADAIIEEAGLHDIKIVYRPHPWREKRKCFDLFEPEKYRHVILDPQVEADYYGEKQKGTESVSSQNFPKLQYYPSLVNHALFTISPMSSMTLESALFDVPALIIAHDDGVHPIPPNLQLQYRHFQGAEEIPGWFVAHDMEGFRTLFGNLLRMFQDESPARRSYRPYLSQSVLKYLHHDGRTYAERLYDATLMILAAHASNGGRAA